MFNDGLAHPITNTDHPNYYAEDYSSEEGTALYAPTIGGISVQWKTRLYTDSLKGQVLVLEHNGKHQFKVLIGHISEYKVKHDVRVTSGDLIALSGGSVDASYPVGVTTAPHTHCEWIIDEVWGKPFDMEINVYKSPDIDTYLQERAAPDLQDKAELLISLGNEYRIKPEFIVAIMKADTSLGAAMATTNNPGNVGNTDGGARRGFDTMEQGIEAIFKTLNNQYLSYATMTGELSGDGRVALSLSGCASNCYATSLNGYWNGNVLAVLQTLHNDPSIDEYFNFRF